MTTHLYKKRRRVRACSACDLVCVLPVLRPGEQANCARCGHVLARRHLHPVQRSIALAITALISLILAVAFPFIGVDAGSLDNQIGITQTAGELLHLHQPVVAMIVAFSVIVLPALYLTGVIVMQAGMLRNVQRNYSDFIARTFSKLHPWMMADVFIIAALVSLVKLVGMAEVHLGASFWAYCIFAVLLLITTRSVDTGWLWCSLAGEPAPPAGIQYGISAAAQHMTGCPTCGLVNSLSATGTGKCLRCGDRLHLRTPHSLQRTWALLVTAIVLYIPANTYPMMITTSFGQSHTATIIGGMIEFWKSGSQPIAAIIFIASILVPVLKILSLILLSWAVYRGVETHALHKTRLYHMTELIGRWSMVDVFVVAIMVALIQSGNLMSITPGPAALAFCAVVVVTMLAAMAFDPRLIWDSQGNRHE